MAPPAAAPSALVGTSLLATALLLINNTIGAGLLALPYVFLRSGLVAGACAMALTGALNAFTAVLIAQDCAMCGARSYVELATRALGARWAAAISVLMAVYTLGSCASYAVLLGDALPELADSGLLPAALAASPWASRAVLLPACAALVLLPLSSQRTLRSLRFTAAASFVCIAYVAGLVIARAARAPRAATAVNFKPGLGFFVGIPITMVSFTCHYNVPRMYFEMEARSVPRLAAAAAICFGFAMAVYEGTALAGYFLFGASTKNDILSNFADDDGAALVARAALVLVMCFSFPIVFNSFRAASVSLLPLAWQERIDLAGSRAAAEAEAEAEEEAVGSRKIAATPAAAAAFSPARWCAALARDWAFLLATAVLVTACVLVAVAIPDLSAILGYKGALGGTLLVYVLPGAFFFALVRQRAQRGPGAESCGEGGGDPAAPESPAADAADAAETPRRVPAARFLSFAPLSARSAASAFSLFGSVRRAAAPAAAAGEAAEEGNVRATHTPLLWGSASPAAASTPLSEGGGGFGGAFSAEKEAMLLAAAEGGGGGGGGGGGLAGELLTTPAGLLALALGAWGFAVMGLGTATTAGLIK
jgi:amino acid permease